MNKGHSTIVLSILSIASLMGSCGNNANQQGGKYTYSYFTYGTTVVHDTVFAAQNDTAAYIWALDKFNGDKKAVYSEFNMSDMDVFTAFRIPKEFTLRKGNTQIRFDDLKTESMIEDETVAYDGAYFGMTLSDVKALPQFSSWKEKVSEDTYYADNGLKIPVKASTLTSRSTIGDFEYNVSLAFNYADKLAQVSFKSDGTRNDILYNRAESQFRYLIRKRYGFSNEDIESGRLDDSNTVNHWDVGDKWISLFQFPGDKGTEIHAYFSSHKYPDEQENHFKELAEERGKDKVSKLTNDANKF